MIDEAEVVIWGSCPFDMIRPRLLANKLTFAYSERLFKNAHDPIGNLGRMAKYFLRLKAYQKKHYLLCASAYAAEDYARIGLFKGRAYRWGYFPVCAEIADTDAFFAAKVPHSILFAGRMIDWKHPELPIRIAKRLTEEGIDFSLDMIGTGILEEKLRAEIESLGLSDRVHMHGAVAPSVVRQYMDHADIFLFPSDRNEGWGAVLNESMNSGCAVVANRAIGSVPFLLENEKNGLCYDTEEALYAAVKTLLLDRSLCKKYGSNAIETVSGVWRAQSAAERFCALANAIKSGCTDAPKSGPCSKI